MARIEQQVGVAVVDAGAGARRRDQPLEQRRDALRIDREVEVVELVRAGNEALARLQLQQLLGIDVDGIGLDGRRRRDSAGDDLALRHQALDARVDQPVAESVEIEDADDENGQRRQVEEQDAPRQAREDVVAEETPQRHRHAAERRRNGGQPPLRGGLRRLLEIYVNGHSAIGTGP